MVASFSCAEVMLGHISGVQDYVDKSLMFLRDIMRLNGPSWLSRAYCWFAIFYLETSMSHVVCYNGFFNKYIITK